MEEKPFLRASLKANITEEEVLMVWLKSLKKNNHYVIRKVR